jgi:capsular exopolysaccharide synthesis family protein
MSDGQHTEASREAVLYNRLAAAREPLMLPTLEEGAWGSERNVPLAAYWYVIFKHRWTIFSVTLVLTTVAAIVSFLMTPIYKATAHLEIEPETPGASADLYQRADADDPFLQTQIQVLKSENLAWQTIGQLGLAAKLGVIPLEAPTKEEIDKHKVQLIGAFENDLKIELLPKTRMLSVGFEGPEPQLAAQVATSLVNNYLDYNFRQKYEAIRRSGWMEQQLDELKANVQKSQQALVTYEQQNQIVNSGDKQNVLEQMLGDLSRNLTNATSDRIEKESLYRQVLANRNQMASLVHDDLLEKLEEKLADLKEQHTQTVAQYGPNFPNAKRLQLEVDEAQAQIEREQSRVLDRMNRDFNAAYNRERLAETAVFHQKDDVGRLNQLLVQDNILRHEFDTNQQLYESLLQRLKDATVSAGLRSTNIHLVDSALPPRVPVRPRKLLNIAIAFWAGMILGVMVAFAKEALDSSIKTAEEAEALIVTPALGIIPFERISGFLRRAISKKGGVDQLALTLTKRPNCSMSEAFRALGTAVCRPSNSIKTLLIASAQNGEGKTTTALNLAQALAQRKGPVLIMDCDLRKGGVAQALGIRNHKGLSNVLSGELDVSQVAQQYAPQPNLWVLTSGPVPFNPVRLLASQNMATLLDRLAESFEYVIIDSPPVLAVTDAAILSCLVDGVLLVAASGSTERGGLVRTRRILVGAGARILGIAVNKLDPRSPGYGNYAYSHYVYK